MLAVVDGPAVAPAGAAQVAVVVRFGTCWTRSGFAGGRRPRTEPLASLQWRLGHLPLTAAVAAMGAAMVSLVDHAHDGHSPAVTAWVLCAGATVVLGATMLLAGSLQAGHRDRGLYWLVGAVHRTSGLPESSGERRRHSRGAEKPE